mmetsp:Transcript_15322/g.33113  ORF Transcript_15322/g.33113 Transcript_15322/m.33113 type:complete len:479 (-) Transcript_15322:200-1636(-)|eukprot:CAMPEP_0206455906 /NCGR_PEP_ID=MMETSP0324_2-20121206/22052_1 /ASSEMBLY_ACC=CAM_ASM_000836 /TAXON_ID=2866 /ORGANISM="Crypthecodinium cohnii, Strain Seligo" /LENGTH=478 /DNA_ID=CAMNT_0053926741 /DNA_START=92 /DNA_END=1528 /DNA_ORIENTATION=+
MISYEHGNWGIMFIFRYHGSVFPKALIWSFPAGIVAIVSNYIKTDILELTEDDLGTPNTVMTAFSGFIMVLGFTAVFRSNQAWARYWEGAALVQQMRGEWFNATSSLFAFCSRKPDKKKQVEKFQADIVRLISLLFGTALSTLSGSNLPLLDQNGIGESSSQFLQHLKNEASQSCELRCEVILQWAQRKIVLAIDDGTLDVAPPILSRVFQDLGRGIVSLASARKINELPFPFHYAQMLTVMLLIYTVGVSVGSGFLMYSYWSSAGIAFLNVFVLWSVNYLAAEIEQPFGTDYNDLPIQDELTRMNECLKILLDQQCHNPVVYTEVDVSQKSEELRTQPPKIQSGAWEPIPVQKAKSRFSMANEGVRMSTSPVGSRGSDPSANHSPPKTTSPTSANKQRDSASVMSGGADPPGWEAAANPMPAPVGGTRALAGGPGSVDVSIGGPGGGGGGGGHKPIGGGQTGTGKAGGMPQVQQGTV